MLLFFRRKKTWLFSGGFKKEFKGNKNVKGVIDYSCGGAPPGGKNLQQTAIGFHMCESEY